MEFKFSYEHGGCDGDCEEHVGDIIKVKVFDDYSDVPWVFNYCEEAIREDMMRGFRVIPYDGVVL